MYNNVTVNVLKRTIVQQSTVVCKYFHELMQVMGYINLGQLIPPDSLSVWMHQFIKVRLSTDAETRCHGHNFLQACLERYT